MTTATYGSLSASEHDAQLRKAAKITTATAATRASLALSVIILLLFTKQPKSAMALVAAFAKET
jgi:hypothetical protein